MADTCTQLAGPNGGRIGDVARGIGGPLVSPPLNVSDVKRYFGDVKQFPQVAELLRVVQHGFHMETEQSQADFKKMLNSVREPQNDTGPFTAGMMGKTSERCTNEQVPIFKKEAVAELEDVRVASLGAVVTSKVQRFSFRPDYRPRHKRWLEPGHPEARYSEMSMW